MKLPAVSKFAKSLPEVTDEPHHDSGSFRVRGKIFVTVPPGGEWLHVFVPDALRDEALAIHGSFTESLTWGGKVVGLRLRLADADEAAVRRLVLAAWRHKAPKGLADPMPEQGGNEPDKQD